MPEICRDVRRYLTIYAALMILIAVNCSQESPTVVPDPASQAFTGSVTGTSDLQLTGSYPENLDTGIPVDADIVLVFSKPVDITTVNAATVSITDGFTPVTAFTPTLASGGRTVIIDVTAPAALSYGATYTITITNGIQSDPILDPPGYPLSSGTSWDFTAATSTALVEAPRVIAATRYPTGAAVSVSTNYVEVTFTRTIDNATIDTTSFTIAPAVQTAEAGAGTGVDPDGVDTTTYRLYLTTPLTYSQAYIVDLTAAIQDTAVPANPLEQDGNDTWTFTAEADPAPAGAATIPSLWIDSVSDTGATVSFTTSKPVAPANCYILYDTVTPVTTGSSAVQESAATALTTVHTVTIPAATFSPSTRYYIRAGVDTGGGLPVEILSTLATELTIYTKTNTTLGVNEKVSTAANNQNDFVTVQIGNGTGYAFWVDNGINIYGEFFGTTTPSGTWGDPGGLIDNAGGAMKKVTAITNGFSDAVVIFQEDVTNILYARTVYNNAGALAQRWAQTSLGITIKAGSSFSACLVHERPAVITTGVADMPNNGTANPLLYDRDTNFTTLGLANNDILVWLNAGTWNNATIADTNSYNIFRYVIRHNTVTALGAYSYYLAGQTSSVSGQADTIIDANNFQADDLNLSLGAANPGDIINCNGTWAIITAKVLIGGFVYQITTDVAHTLAATQTYTVYPYIDGPNTSEAVTNPLWDEVPSTLFNPGTTVKTGDYVVNGNNYSAAASSATVAAINLALDTDYALRLSLDIMNNGDNYSIVRLPGGSTYRAVGYSTNVATNYVLIDLNAPFGAVSAGDIVFNIDSTPVMSAMVTAAVAGQLTLTADIFNTVNEKAIVYTKRGFLVAFIDTNDYVLARSFNIADGSNLGAAFAVCTNGTNTTPVAVSDGAGNAIVFYEQGGSIYVKKVSATGAFVWSNVNADQASDAGITVLAGYSIVQALPDRATGGVGGAFLLADNGAGTVALVRVNGATGAVASTTFTGSDPHMVADTTGGTGDRIILTYRNSHVVGTGTYYHIEVRAYNILLTTAAPGFPAVVATNNTTAEYHCEQPRITISDSAAGNSQFTIAWFDGRYIAFIGYSLYARQYNTDGTIPGAGWTNEVFISSPGSAGYTNTLLLGLLSWDDDGGIAPFGIIPIWLDYRNKGVTGTDIYYENVTDTGSF